MIRPIGYRRFLQGGAAIDTPPDTFSTAFDPPGGDFHFKPSAHYSCTLSRRTAQPTWEPVTQHRFLIRWASLLIESCRDTASFIETMDDSRRAPYPKPMGIPKTTQREDCGTRRKPQQPRFPHPRRICLTDSLIPADTSDRERRKARGMGYPTATRLAPADLLGRRGNGATLLMLPPRGPREVARGGEPRGGECLLQTNVRSAASATSLRTQVRLNHLDLETPLCCFIGLRGHGAL